MERRITRHTVLLAALVLLAACGPSAEDVAELRSQQKQILAKLNDLEKKIDARPAAAPGRAQVDPNKVWDITVAASAIRGPKDAPVTISEFSDFQCPFCAQAATLVEQVMKDYPKEVRFVYKQYPLPMHPFAMDAAKASIAAGKQGKFWEMHDILFKNSRALQPEKIKDYAKEIGLDVAKFDADMKSPEIEQQVKDDMKLGGDVQVTGTPTIFVNGKRLMNRSPEGFKAMIDEVLKAKQAS